MSIDLTSLSESASLPDSQATAQEDSFAHLPPELLATIANLVSLNAVKNLKQVNRYWKKIVSDSYLSSLREDSIAKREFQDRYGYLTEAESGGKALSFLPGRGEEIDTLILFATDLSGVTIGEKTNLSTRAVKENLQYKIKRELQEKPHPQLLKEIIVQNECRFELIQAIEKELKEKIQHLTSLQNARDLLFRFCSLGYELLGFKVRYTCIIEALKLSMDDLKGVSLLDESLSKCTRYEISFPFRVFIKLGHITIDEKQVDVLGWIKVSSDICYARWYFDDSYRQEHKQHQVDSTGCILKQYFDYRLKISLGKGNFDPIIEISRQAGLWSVGDIGSLARLKNHEIDQNLQFTLTMSKSDLVREKLMQIIVEFLERTKEKKIEFQMNICRGLSLNLFYAQAPIAYAAGFRCKYYHHEIDVIIDRTIRRVRKEARAYPRVEDFESFSFSQFNFECLTMSLYRREKKEHHTQFYAIEGSWATEKTASIPTQINFSDGLLSVWEERIKKEPILRGKCFLPRCMNNLGKEGPLLY